MKKSYLPKKSSERVIWLNNFAQSVATYGTMFGFSNTQITSVAEDAAAYSYIVNLADSVDDFSKTITEFKKLLSIASTGLPLGNFPLFVQPTPPTPVQSGIFSRIGKIVAGIKSNTNYTDVIGKDMGIIGSESNASRESMKPVLTVKLNVGKPEIAHVIGDSDSLHIYANHDDGKGMIFFANTTLKKFVDKTALPDGVNSAVWHYKAVYVIDDQEVGEFSDEVTVTVNRNV